MRHAWRQETEPYKGLSIRCAPGVHEAAAALLCRHTSTSAGVLDLASGSGAFLSRLKDAGFQKLQGVERELAGYGLTEVPCQPIDLDQPFAQHFPGTFDAITAIEIIEHLSSPLAFLKQARQLLNADGLLLVSTPNVAEWQSRIKFLLTGNLRYFDAAQYVAQRHLSPLLPALVPFMLREAGLQLVALQTVGSFDGPLRRATLGALATALARLKHDAMAVGECILFAARPIGAVSTDSQ